jgi:hypothetical protein
VDVGTSENIAPVLSGKGLSLITNMEREFWLPKGARFYVTSQTINRLSVIIEPVPMLHQIALEIVNLGNRLVEAFAGFGKTSAPGAAKTSSGKTAAEISCPTPRRIFLPKLRR